VSRSLRRSDGFALVELLIGIALGVLAVSAALLFFAANKRHFLVQLEATRLQENQRFVVQFLTRDIRGAGYRGCAGDKGPFFNTLNAPNTLEHDFRTGIEGFDNVPETLPGPLAGTFAGARRVPIAGTDVLVVRGPAGDASGVRAESTATQIFAVIRSRKTNACTGGVNRINGICPGDYLLISDCQKARIFQVGSIEGSGAITHSGSNSGPGSANGTWSGAAVSPHARFGTDSEIIRYATFIYYLASNPGGEPALYRKVTGRRAEELVEGVEDMQILYGENIDADADGTPDRFVAAAGVIDWDNVTAIRVWVLLRGFRDNRAEAEQRYPALDGTTITAPDKRLRKPLVLTIGLRNRLPQ